MRASGSPKRLAAATSPDAASSCSEAAISRSSSAQYGWTPGSSRPCRAASSSDSQRPATGSPRRARSTSSAASRPSQRLEERLGERAADAERLADRAHLAAEHGLRAGELGEVEARRLDRDVVERRLERRRRLAGDVVRKLVERVADREQRRQLRDREAGRLRRERRRARDARVHLDHAQLAVTRLVRELHVRAARRDADGARARERSLAQPLVLAVRQRLLRRDRPRVAGVHAHRVEVLDRADDDAVAARRRSSPRARAPAQPARKRSTSTWPIGLAARPAATCARSSSRVCAIPPPVPPSVNAGRTIAGTGKLSASATDETITLSGTCRPAAVIVSRKSSRSSARRIASRSAPISSTPSRSRTPASERLEREVQRRSARRASAAARPAARAR